MRDVRVVNVRFRAGIRIGAGRDKQSVPLAEMRPATAEQEMEGVASTRGALSG